MPALPWTGFPADDGSKVVVMASRLEVRSFKDVPGFFRASMTVLRQAKESDGIRGVALKADLARRTFWTVSVWRDREAVHAYAAAEPHRSTMRAKRAVMRDSTFVFWDAETADPVPWTEVERRITAQRTPTT